MSRDRLGPDPEPKPESPAHGIRYVEREGGRYRATCFCGFSKRRRTPSLARFTLEAHIVEGNAQS